MFVDVGFSMFGKYPGERDAVGRGMMKVCAALEKMKRLKVISRLTDSPLARSIATEKPAW